MRAYNPNTGKVEAGRWGMLGQPLLGNHSGESLGYMTLSNDGGGGLKTMMDWEDGQHTQVCQ